MKFRLVIRVSHLLRVSIEFVGIAIEAEACEKKRRPVPQGRVKNVLVRIREVGVRCLLPGEFKGSRWKCQM